MVDVNSIVSALRHRKIAAFLIVVEIAVAFAILSNALFLIGVEFERVTIRSGTTESELLDVTVAPTPGREMVNADATLRGDLRALAEIAGVKAASALNQVPYGGGGWFSGIALKPDLEPIKYSEAQEVTVYLGDESALETLGVRLVAGRGFRADEVVPFAPDVTPPIAILTRAAATRLFGRSSAVGRVIYMSSGQGKTTPVTVIGVIERLLQPFVLAGQTTEQSYSIIRPERPSFAGGVHYVIRASRTDMPQVEREVKEALAKSDPPLQILSERPLTEVKSAYFREERSMAWTLAIVCLALLIVTAAGIFGLTSVWMRERVHQIGIRRALGATRGQILVHYMLENFPLAVGGVLLGSALAFATSSFLLAHGYSSSRLPLLYVAVGAAILLGLNQLAVFTPARRAATIAPAEATRL